MNQSLMEFTTMSHEDTPNPEEDIQLNSNRGGLATFIARIPKSYVTHLGKILGHFLYYLDVPHRRIVWRNLKFIHPEYPPGRIQNLSRRFFQHFGITVLELIQMSFFSCEDVIRNSRIEGIENLIEALAKQKGVVLISAHLGNWETAWQIGPCYFQQQITGVAKELRNVQLNRLIENRRTRFGNRILYKKGALPDMMQTLRQGKIVAILMDVSRRFDGVEVNFFGRRATATPAAALLALRCKSPVIPAFCYRDAKGKMIVRIDPPVELMRTKDLRTDIQANTQLITDRVELAIQKDPAQWFWTLKRWKDFYPDLYPESEKRQQRIQKKEKKRNHQLN